MTAAEKPGDPADRATDAKADGAFGGLTNHRGGYGDDKLQRVIGWLRERPTATLASGEGGLLLAEIDRQNAAIERVRALHAPSMVSAWNPFNRVWTDCCRECWDNDRDLQYPCPTLRALDGDA